MLIYEKKVEENNEMVRHLFGTEANIPSADDVQLTYADADGDPITDLTVDTKLFDDGHGGMKLADGEAVSVWIGNKNVIPGTIVVALSGIVVATKPTKLTYAVNDKLDLTGMVVKGKYSDGTLTTSALTYGTDFTTTPADEASLTEAGSKMVKVEGKSGTDYAGFSTSFKITVS